MAREVLPVKGCFVTGFYGAPLSWWRRALVKAAKAVLRWASKPNGPVGYAGSPVFGEHVDPERIYPVGEWRIKHLEDE